MCRITLSLLFIFLLINACGVLQRQEQKEEKPLAVPLTKQDSLQASSLFIEAKKEDLLGNSQSAISLYNRVLEINPWHDASLFELARIYGSTGNFRKAHDYAQKAVHASSNNVWYRKLLVNTAQQTGQPEVAREQFKWLVKHEEQNLEYYQDWYALERRAQNYEEALSILEEILQIQGPSEAILLKKTRMHQELNNYTGAIETLDQLLAIDPENPDYYREIIAMHNREHQYDKALEAIKQFKQSGKDNGMASLLLAEQHRITGDKGKAFEALSRAMKDPRIGIDVKVNVIMTQYLTTKDSDKEKRAQGELLSEHVLKAHPEDPVAWALKGDLHMLHQEFEKAAGAFEKVIAKDKSQFTVWQQLLRLQMHLQAYDKVTAYADTAISLFPQEPLFYLLKGVAHLEKQEYSLAAKTLNTGLYFTTDQGTKTDLYTQLGEAYHQKGEHEASDQAFEKALQLEPHNIIVLNNYAYYLSLRGESLKKALEMSKKTIERSPNNPTFLDTYGWILYQKGQYKKAHEALKAALEHGGINNPVILEHYGDCLMKLNQEEEAILYWKKAKEISDTPQVLKEKIKTHESHEP